MSSIRAVGLVYNYNYIEHLTREQRLSKLEQVTADIREYFKWADQSTRDTQAYTLQYTS